MTLVAVDADVGCTECGLVLATGIMPYVGVGKRLWQTTLMVA